jgi:predicted HTH transcriptional regulator
MDTAKAEVSISDMITEGEHDGLEFKSSMRWDTKQNGLNKSLEKILLKTIAAFNNGYGDGGTLIIGVDDDGAILGLENDLNTLKGDDADAYESHLRNLVSAEFGIEYAASSIRVNFHEVLGLIVCAVTVSKGTAPLFVKDFDKNGAKIEKFFVRAGNASDPISNPSDISNYISKRFKSA